MWSTSVPPYPIINPQASIMHYTLNCGVLEEILGQRHLMVSD